MNREDLAKLYEKANGWSPAAFKITMEELERFAALVASEKEKQIIDILERLHERHGETHNYYAYAVRVIKGEI